MVDPLTLVRFAELTARLERSASRQAVLDEAGIAQQHWLSEQQRWLEEMSKRIALNRPRLFQHFCALVEAERQRLGLPPRVKKPNPAEPRGARFPNAQLVAPNAPASSYPGTTTAGADAATPPELSRTPWEIPEYLRTAGPMAPPRGGPMRAVPDNLPVFSTSPVPAPHWSGVPEPRAVGHTGAHAKSQPPRLDIREYAELSVLLERDSMGSGASALGRFGLNLAEWFDEVVYWNRAFTEKRADVQKFEDLLNFHRGKST